MFHLVFWGLLQYIIKFESQTYLEKNAHRGKEPIHTLIIFFKYWFVSVLKVEILTLYCDVLDELSKMPFITGEKN